MTDQPPSAPVRVVTIAFNPGRELEEFASTLAGAGADVELVIVDNGTDPSVVDDVGATYADVLGARVLRPGGNLGYGAAANLGTRGAAGEWIVVANPDVAWRPGTLAELVAAGLRHPEAGALGPRILNTDGTVYPSARALPSLVVGSGHALFAKVWTGNPWSRAYREAQEAVADTERAVGWLSGACLLLRRTAWEQIGGFDEAFFMFFEDVDLGDRLGRAGWRSVYAPGALVVHDQGASWRDQPATMIRAHHASAETYLHRRYGAFWQAPLRVALSAGLRTRCAWQTRGR